MLAGEDLDLIIVTFNAHCVAEIIHSCQRLHQCVHQMRLMPSHLRGTCVSVKKMVQPRFHVLSNPNVFHGFHLSLCGLAWSRSSDGLALFVSSTDGYVSKMHFEPGELGDTLPCSDVPLQTRRLHPVIYDWQTEVTPTEEVAGRVLRPSPPPSGVVRVETPAQAGGEVSTGKALGLAPAPSPLPVVTKQKKKIVPTLVTPMPAADRAQPVASSTAVPPSPTTPSTERKKRRITPTLCVPGTNEDTSGDDALVSGTQSPLPASAKHVAVGNETPKKKRLAPTLVSAL